MRVFRNEVFEASDGENGIRLVEVRQSEHDALVAENEALRERAERAEGERDEFASRVADLEIDVDIWRTAWDKLAKRLIGPIADASSAKES